MTVIRIQNAQVGGDLRHSQSLLSVWFVIDRKNSRITDQISKYWSIDSKILSVDAINSEWKRCLTEYVLDPCDLLMPVTTYPVIVADRVYRVTHQLSSALVLEPGALGFAHVEPLFTLSLIPKYEFTDSFIETRALKTMTPEVWTDLVVKATRLFDDLKNLDLTI